MKCIDIGLQNTDSEQYICLLPVSGELEFLRWILPTYEGILKSDEFTHFMGRIFFGDSPARSLLSEYFPLECDHYLAFAEVTPEYRKWSYLSVLKFWTGSFLCHSTRDDWQQVSRAVITGKCKNISLARCLVCNSRKTFRLYNPYFILLPTGLVVWTRHTTVIEAVYNGPEEYLIE